MERTFAIIKPDAVKKGVAGRILARIEEAGFAICALRMIHMSKAEAEGFYDVHESASVFRRADRFHVVGSLHRACASRRRTRSRSGAT